jgi:hypothetical protein
MKKNQDKFYGLILMCIGATLLVLVGGPMLLSMLALAFGLYLINYGLILTGGPSLFTVIQQTVEDIRGRFFKD